MSDDPALGVQQDGLHVSGVRPEAGLQPGSETGLAPACLHSEAVEGALHPRPLVQVPQPWLLVSLAPGRSCGSAVKSHVLSSVGIPKTHTRTRIHACTGMHTVPSQVQSPLLVTPSPSLAPRWNMSPPRGPGAWRKGGR